ncbi:hypothetical protein Sjap_008039 [Stephania japonica]|uniref:Uncharacterized protein n=1 Tax=Stephania japonica TaxID=461633 RepID=A0AAP0JQZ4_9MAGN
MVEIRVDWKRREAEGLKKEKKNSGVLDSWEEGRPSGDNIVDPKQIYFLVSLRLEIVPRKLILLLVVVVVGSCVGGEGVVAVRALEGKGGGDGLCVGGEKGTRMAHSKKLVTGEETGNTVGLHGGYRGRRPQTTSYRKSKESVCIMDTSDVNEEQEVDGEDEGDEGENEDQEEVDEEGENQVEEGEQEDSEEVEVRSHGKAREADMASAFKMANDVLMHLIGKGVASSATTTSGGNEPTRKSEHDSHATQSQSHTNANESGSSKHREHGKLQHKKKRSKTNE